MKTVQNQAFWREVLEHVSGIILVFRVDHDGSMHLIYANQALKAMLGFSPEQFVMLSESDGVQENDLHKLSDKLLSNNTISSPGISDFCLMHDSDMNVIKFNFRYDKYQTTAGKSNIIVVTMWPVHSEKNSQNEEGKDSFDILPYNEATAAYLRKVLEKTGGKIYGPDGAAACLKLKPTTLQSKLKKLGVK